MRDQLRDKGYCVIKNALNSNQISEISMISRSIVSQISSETRELQKGLGSIIPIENHENVVKFWHKNFPIRFIEMIVKGKLDIIYGVIFSKPMNSGPTFWHQDALYWDQEEAYTDQIIQINILVYLCDTNSSTGSLRIIPGSHRYKNPIHLEWINMLNRHENNLSKVINILRESEAKEAWSLNSKEDMEELSSKAGDLIILDSRLLHGTFSNEMLNERILHSFSGIVDNKVISMNASEDLKMKRFTVNLRLPNLEKML